MPSGYLTSLRDSYARLRRGLHPTGSLWSKTACGEYFCYGAVTEQSR